MNIPTKDEIIKARQEKMLPGSISQNALELLKTLEMNSYRKNQIKEEYLKAMNQIKVDLEKLKETFVPQVKIKIYVRNEQLALFIKQQLEEKGYNVDLNERRGYDIRDNNSWLDGYDFIITI